MQSRPSLELRQHQQLALTPQLQQSIRFLQLSAHDLEQEVVQALQDNPLLEREEDYDADAQARDREVQWLSPGGAGRNRGGRFQDAGGEGVLPEAPVPVGLRDHLMQQLGATRATARDRMLVEVLIDELDDNGYLATPLDEIAASLRSAMPVEPGELRAALRLLQSFDPVGVGAVSLSECLCLQLQAFGDSRRKQEDPDVLQCATAIARHHLDILSSGNLVRLRSVLRCPEPVLRSAHSLLLRLEPRPGRAWSTTVADYVTPDVLVRRVQRQWQASINPMVMPRLRVNAAYEHLLDGSPALQEQLQQAQGIVRSMHQRFVTILRVAQAVVDRQEAFFRHGMEAMRPLVLRDIAEDLGLHESTVSRATRHKYAQTPWGVIELKRFFGSSVPAADGETTSAAAVQTLIARLVAAENRHKPLSDSKIADKLAEQGVIVARRTVAKYREAAGIAPAILRKARAALESS